VHFVNHIDLVSPGSWRVNRVIEQLRHLVDTAIRCSVKLQVVNKSTHIDFGTGTALTARGRTHTLFTVDGLRQDSRDRRLTDASGTGKKLRMVKPAGFQRMVERPNDVILANQGIECPGTPLTGQNLMRHSSSITALTKLQGCGTAGN